MRRTMLFLPGNNPNMIVNGGLLGSDSIILDLEDAVSPDNKDAARNLVAQTLKAAVDVENPVVVVTYKDSQGNVIVSQEFTSGE